MWWRRRRTREIGIRVALGAEPRRVRWMVLIEGLGVAAVAWESVSSPPSA